MVDEDEQTASRSDYLGYRLTTYVGYSLRRISHQRVERDAKADTESTVFVTIYAGLHECRSRWGLGESKMHAVP